jgi:hypothetical protein
MSAMKLFMRSSPLLWNHLEDSLLAIWILCYRSSKQGQHIVKGKLVLEIDGKQPQKLKEKTTEPSWTPPREGWVKWNTDGSFDSGGEAGAGIVVLSSCKQLQGCL